MPCKIILQQIYKVFRTKSCQLGESKSCTTCICTCSQNLKIHLLTIDSSSVSSTQFQIEINKHAPGRPSTPLREEKAISHEPLRWTKSELNELCTHHIYVLHLQCQIQVVCGRPEASSTVIYSMIPSKKNKTWHHTTPHHKKGRKSAHIRLWTKRTT
jgi:hypothetical protein